MKQLLSFFLTIFLLISFAGHSQFWNDEMDSIATPNSKWGWIFFNDSVDIDPEELFEQFGGAFNMAEDDSMAIYDTLTDQLGITHHKFQQSYKGIEVFGSTYFVHSYNGKAFKANGIFVDGISLSTTPSISESVALDSALDAIGAESYIWSEADSTHFPEATLAIVRPPDSTLAATNYKLAYKFEIISTDPADVTAIIIDANSGAVINSGSAVLNCQPGEACTATNGEQEINATYYWDKKTFSLIDDCRGDGIRTLKNNAPTGIPPYGEYGDRINDADNDWDTDCHISTIHWATEMFYDFLLEMYGRKSYDGKGAIMNSFIDSDYPNASFSYVFKPHTKYGVVPSYGTPMASLDVVGHEWGHAVDLSANGVAHNTFSEAGALGESFADIFGTLLEFYAEDLHDPNHTDDWDILEDFWPSAWNSKLRDMANPHAKNNPDTYGGTYWSTGCYTAPYGPTSGQACEDGHNRSGVQNKWFYLLSEGGSGTNNHPTNPISYNVTGIGKYKAGAIAFRNLTVYLTINSTFQDARDGSIQAAIDLFGECSDEVIEVAKAWDAVGVYDQNCFYACIQRECFTTGTGEATVRVVGGTPPYNYSWDDPGSQTTATATGLDPGNYTVSIEDDAQCQVEVWVNIVPSSTITADAYTTYNYCPTNKGTALANPSGGLYPYSFQWDDDYNRSSYIIKQLEAGTYNVTITDRIGCTATTSEEVSDAYVSHPNGLTISSNTTWNSVNYQFGDQLIIKSGAMLTVNNSTLEFMELPPDKMNVVVEKGARFKVYKSELTGYTECGTMWNGVVVEGNANYKPLPDPRQDYNWDQEHGFFYFYGSSDNKSVCRDSRRGVIMGYAGNKDYAGAPAGGTIYTDYAEFINNRRSIQFTRFGYPHATRIRNTLFDSDQNFLDKASYFSHTDFGTILDYEMNKEYISATNAKGIYLNACTFTHEYWNHILNYPRPYKRGKGIVLFNSEANIEGQNSFANLDTAIDIRGYFSYINIGVPLPPIILTPKLRMSVIGGNSFDNNLGSIYCTAPDILRVINNNYDIPASAFYDTYGLFKMGRGFTRVYDNTFAGGPGPGTKYTYGAVIDRTGKNTSTIFRNQFSDTDYGLQIQGENPGLSVRCNTFAHNNNPHFRKSWTNVLDDNNLGSLKDQGEIDCDFDDEKAAGNQWDDECIGTSSQDIYVEDKSLFDFEYYAHYRDHTTLKLTPMPLCSSTDWENLGALHPYQCATEKNSTSCDKIFPLLPPPPTDENYAAYINSAADIVDDQEEAIDAYETALESLSGDEADSVRHLVDNTQMDMRLVESEAIATILEFEDSITPQFLDTMHTVVAKQALAELYFGLDSLTLAQQALDSIAVMDTSDEVDDYISLMDILIDLREADTSLNGLDSIQILTIRRVAEGTTSMALTAESMLQAVFGEQVHHPIYKIQEEAGKRGQEDEKPAAEVSEIMVFPNPTTGEVTFAFPEVTTTGTKLHFYDVRGHQIQTIEMPEGISTYQISLTMPSGLYFYTVTNSHDILHSGKLVNIK